jgi:uncharacterized protein YicC (UPF0701 family)
MFDDIAEEELGYIFLQVQKRLGNETIKMGDIASGTKGATIKGSEYFDQAGDKLYHHFIEAFQEKAKTYNQTYELGGKQLKKVVSGKVDLNAGTVNISSKTTINEDFFKEILPYLNQATFTVKNYKNTTFEQ